MRDRDEVEALKALANSNMGKVLGRLRVSDKPRGRTGYIAMCDPMTRDADPSLVIWTTRPGGLSWKRYGSDARGDIIDLVAYLNGWFHLPKRGSGEAIRWLKDVLGFETMTPAQRRRDAEKARARAAGERKKAEQDLQRDRGRAFGIWLQRKDWRGTVVETYLREARGIDLRLLPRAPQILGYLPDHEHIAEKTGERTRWPCMVCGVGDGNGIMAVHRTWLLPDGSGKAPVKPQRKVWPSFAGLVLPLWRGEYGMSIGEAVKHGVLETLVITEGVEDGFTAAIAAPQYRTWGMISLSNLRNIVLPPCIDGVLIHRQSEWANRQAVEDFEAGKAAIEAQGVPVAEIRAR